MRCSAGIVLLMFASATAFAGPPPYDPAALVLGDARFDLVLKDEVQGEWFVSRRLEDGDYVVIDSTTLYPATRETAALVVDAKTFAPRRLVIDADFNGSILDADLMWKDGALVGEYRTKKTKTVDKRTVPFDKKVADGVTLRGVTFHLIPTLPLKAGASWEVQWFNSLNGKVEDVVLAVTGPETVQTRAGEYRAWRVSVTGSAVENVVFVSDEVPRDVVRVDVVGQDMVFLRR